MALLTTGTESMTQVTDIIHDFFWPVFEDQFPVDATLYGKLKKKKVSGKPHLILN